MELNFSNDLGNSTLKGIIDGDHIKIPSNIVVKRPQDNHDPIDIDNIDTKSERDKYDDYIKNYLDHMDIEIKSPQVKTKNRLLVGRSANSSALPIRGFDVSDMQGKADTDLSLILTLGTIAGKALEKYYKQKKHLPENDLTVDVNMITALPIMEGLNNHTLDYYRKRYIEYNHKVIIRNFSSPININIHFNKSTTHVVLEGQTAIYAIKYGNYKDINNTIFSNFKKHYPTLVKNGMSLKELLSLNGIMGIDVGEGTTDIVVFNKDGSINKNASMSIPNGFGNITNEVIHNLQSKHIGVTNRPQIREILNMPKNPITSQKQAPILQSIKDCDSSLVETIVDNVSQTFRKAGTGINVIYVYGGGSIPISKDLRHRLAIEVSNHTGGAIDPIIFINKKYAQSMNVLGLNVLLNSVVNA